MQPMQITAYLAGSIAIARPEDIALDGLLAYQMLRRHFQEQFYMTPDPKECLFFARLPLEMRGSPSERVQSLQTGDVWQSVKQNKIDGSQWYWACSTAQIEVKGRDTQYWNKRFDTQASLSRYINFGGRVEKILIEQGRYKAYHMPLSLLVAEKIVWYAYGDLKQVADLLSPIAAIGKKRAQGQGYVLRWSVEKAAEDWSEWRENRLMRPLPGLLAQHIKFRSFNLQHMAYRAPQWHPLNQMLCVEPGARRQ